MFTKVNQADVVTGLTGLLFSWEQRKENGTHTGWEQGEGVGPIPGGTTNTKQRTYKGTVPLKLVYYQKGGKINIYIYI